MDKKQLTTAQPDGTITLVPEKPKPTVYTAEQLAEEELEPIQFIVADVLAEGVCILSASPKIGKSWFALQLCLAITKGKPFMNKQVKVGEAIYFDFESGRVLQQDRLKKMLNGAKAPRELYYVSGEVPRIGEGFEEFLLDFINEHPGIRLVVIDVFKYIQPLKKNKNESEYESVYRDISSLKKIADEKHLSIILITHNRKLRDEADSFNNVLGSTGIFGASDETILIEKKDRRKPEATISITGRTVQQNDFIAVFNKKTCIWEFKGDLDNYEYQMELEQYNANPIIATIKKCIDKGDGFWKGKASDLIKESHVLGTHIRDDSKSVGRSIKKLEKDLWDYDCIRFDVKDSGGCALYKFYRSIPFEDTPLNTRK